VVKESNRKEGWCFFIFLTLLFLPVATAWGYYFDDRREMSLSGFAYSRAVFALQDGIAGQQQTYYTGNLVQHRNFLTLEWRHNLNRVARDLPTVGSLFQFMNLGAFDYYLNLRTEYDGVYDYGPNKIKQLLGGTRLHAPYFDDPNTATPFDGLYFTPFSATNPNFHPWPSTGMRANDFPANVISLSNRRWARELRAANVRLFEWYFNLTKGPLFIRLGRQNLSWGETDAFRLLDQINPLDPSFGGFLTALDERRIPLNMLRAQWSFGTVGPISDLTLEGFYSIDNQTQVGSALPTSSTFFWNSPQVGTTPIMVGRTPCGGDFMAKRGIPAYAFASTDPRLQDRFGSGYRGSGPGPRHGGGCSVRGDGPHANLEDGRGGGRLVGTISDFTFSLAHYYTYQDLTVIRATVISPTPDHLRWDLGLPTDSAGRPWPTGNPWGPSDPVAARMISSGANPAGQGGIASIAGAERNVRSTVNFQRVQVTGASLSFPVNALTSMFVGSDNPLYYIYTTFRSEIGYFANVPTMRAYAHGDTNTTLSRFLGSDLSTVAAAAGQPVFAPGGVLAHQAGSRTTRITKRDYLAWNIGLDHNQWISWLNPNNSFLFSAQQFWLNRNGQDVTFDKTRPPSVLNDKDVIAGRKRKLQGPVTNAAAAATCQLGTGSRAGCSLWEFPGQEWLTTLVINSQYMGGNLKPQLTFFYDWSGSYLIQPGVDWIFWEPFRASIRYNYLEGRGDRGLGIQNRKDNIWVELQYLLY
jgi:hypothetical protein